VRFSNHLTKADQKAPPLLSKAGNEAWWFGEWSTAVQGKDNSPMQQVKGYWSAVHVREGDAWKTSMLTIVDTPKPAATGDKTTSQRRRRATNSVLILETGGPARHVTPTLAARGACLAWSSVS
jgi:hypothetical protein